LIAVGLNEAAGARTQEEITMPKRIYVGLEKMTSAQLETLARSSGISRAKLEKAARRQIKLTSDELNLISKEVATDPGSVAAGRPRTE
jgi:hypothetical protein